MEKLAARAHGQRPCVSSVVLSYLMKGRLERMRNLAITQVQAMIFFIDRGLHPGGRDQSGRAKDRFGSTQDE